MNQADRAMLATYGYIDRRDQSTVPPEDRMAPLAASQKGGHNVGRLPTGKEITAASQPRTHRPTCPEHDGLCAYRGDESDRCPWCHSTWTAIERSGSHGCERPKAWHRGKRLDNNVHKAWRVETAAGMRREAAQNGGHGPLTPLRYEETPEARYASAPPARLAVA